MVGVMPRLMWVGGAETDVDRVVHILMWVGGAKTVVEGAQAAVGEMVPRVLWVMWCPYCSGWGGTQTAVGGWCTD